MKFKISHYILFLIQTMLCLQLYLKCMKISVILEKISSMNFENNEMWKDAVVDVDRMLLTMPEQEDKRIQAARSSYRATNQIRYVDREREEGLARLV